MADVYRTNLRSQNATLSIEVSLKSQIVTSSHGDESLVCAKFALPKKYGRRVGYIQEAEATIYNLDVIISVGTPQSAYTTPFGLQIAALSPIYLSQ